MQRVKDITKWLEENVLAVEYGEIHVVVRKHEGQISDTKLAVQIKSQCQKKSELAIQEDQ